ncbi:hypothetical protein KDK95_02960 [Actinospica sp. MGRD01-02]|uniref:Tetratricopeptide repeat protein n=1 Tax=Actinospica acidithermotolerans TaxID=2828514 RepID=A0A941IH18_9ACTN|nr:hypothetical protein [Actinospica acidithermotolerans]MBR7825252.1 hypothetical protein [Actinospica acidithermotolerans]
MSGEQNAMPEQQIFDALQQMREEPYGTARTARTEELVDAAERLGHDEAYAYAMLELLGAYEYGGEIPKAPVLFSRILKLREEKPEAFDEWATHRMFWCFKWITTSLLALPEMPLATIEGWIAHMRTYYSAADKPLSAVYTSRMHLATHTGVDLDFAYELWASRPRDEFSDCEACEARNRGIYWAQRGDDERALRAWQPVLDGKLGCAEEPAATVSHALFSLVRTGRLEEAAAAHRTGYRQTRGKVSMNSEVGRHLEFLARTGNAARGLELLAENRGRFDAPMSPADRLSFLQGIRVLLAELAADGHADVPVPGPGGGTHTAGSLLAELIAESDELARRFDERNGTTHVGDTHRARCAGTALTSEPLPLGVRVTPLTAAPAAAATTASPATAPAGHEVPEDFGELLAEAREAAKTGKPTSGDLWDAVAERAQKEADLDGVLRAELAEHAAAPLIRESAWAEAAAQVRAAADLYEEAGEPGRAVARRARAAWLASRAAQDGGEALWTELDGLLATAEEYQASESISATEYLTVRRNRAAAALDDLHAAVLGREDRSAGGSAALAVFEREVEAYRADAIRLGVPVSVATAAVTAAEAMAGTGRLEPALGQLEIAIPLLEAANRPWALAPVLLQQGRLLTALGRLDEGLAALHRALAEWPPEAAAEAVILQSLAHNRMRAGDRAAGIAHLTTAAARYDRAGDELGAVRTRAELGQALLAADRRVDAVAVLESVLDEPAEERMEREERWQLRLDLGMALKEEGEPQAAAEVLARLAEYMADSSPSPARTLVVCELAGALFQAGMPDEASKAVDRAVAANAEGPNPAALEVALREGATAALNRGAEGFAQALAYLDRADEVNEAAEEVDEPGHRYRRWPETGYNAELRGRVLRAAGRHEEALAAAEAAIAAWRVGGDQTFGKYAESARIAATLEGRLGRRKQAVARLAPVISRAREVGHRQAVEILTKLAEDLSG